MGMHNIFITHWRQKKMAQNCWEFYNCKKGLDQENAEKVCPAATEASFNGLNKGENAGRMCWAVTGTFCGGEVQGNFAEKLVHCMKCDFLKQVKQEEGEFFRIMK